MSSELAPTARGTNASTHHPELVRAVEGWSRLKLGVELYRNLEEVPFLREQIREYGVDVDLRLPVDLVIVDHRADLDDAGQSITADYLNIVFAVSASVADGDLPKRVLYYLYHLARLVSSKRLSVSVAAPRQTVDASPKLRDSLDDLGVGLLILDLTNDGWEVTPDLDSRSIRESMEATYAKEVQESPQDFSSPKDVALLFDGYIHQAIDAVVGLSPGDFGKQYIDRALLEQVYALERLSYRGELVAAVDRHLTLKGDEHEFADDLLSALWDNHIGVSYSQFLNDFEPRLQYAFGGRAPGDKTYRDHYLHQFQVFLLGLPVLDKFYDAFKAKCEYPEEAWLLASSFHDVAYPVELYDRWSESFFQDALKVSVGSTNVDLEKCFVKQNLLTSVGYVVNALCSTHHQFKLECNWLAHQHALVEFFYDKITEARNHGILSSVALLKLALEDDNKKKLEEKFGRSSETVIADMVAPAALSIALHEAKIWHGLRDLKGLPQAGASALASIQFGLDPLSFLLVFCDSVHEWGRPSKRESTKRLPAFRLREYSCTDSRVSLELWSPEVRKTDRRFKAKQDELRELQDLLQHDLTATFSVALKDMDSNGEEFDMTGPEG